ncbi:MAG: hypothetical protein ABJC13_02805 [Acidobacteriota bacterium]
MKKLERNNRILGRGLAKELCPTELCNVTGGVDDAAGTPTRCVIIAHTHSATMHDDCYVAATDTDEAVPAEEAAL